VWQRKKTMKLCFGFFFNPIPDKTIRESYTIDRPEKIQVNRSIRIEFFIEEVNQNKPYQETGGDDKQFSITELFNKK
jgi:hypothetical protein